MKEALRYYRVDLSIAAGIGVALGVFMGIEALIRYLILGVLEVSFSFDNAVVNAAVLATMTLAWQRRFMTWGILIAVFGMRFIFPIAIVSITAGLNPWTVVKLAIVEPDKYSVYLHHAHPEIITLGATYLALIALNFFFAKREVMWLVPIERRLASVPGGMSMVITGMAVVVISQVLHNPEILLYGLVSIVLYALLSMLGEVFEQESGKATYYGTTEGSDVSRAIAGIYADFDAENDTFVPLTGGLGELLHIAAAHTKESDTDDLVVFVTADGALDDYEDSTESLRILSEAGNKIVLVTTGAVSEETSAYFHWLSTEAPFAEHIDVRDARALDATTEVSEKSVSISANAVVGGGALVYGTAGFGKFMYLEGQDASFSFDGVSGAFAVTSQILIIVLGLGIGALFVRSMTLHLLHTGKLAEYRYMESGAHWAIGVLAVLMFTTLFVEIPDYIMGLTGVVFIAAAVFSSVLWNRKNPDAVNGEDIDKTVEIPARDAARHQA